MNRCKASVSILLGLILLCISSLLILKQKSMQYLSYLDTFQDAIMQDHTEQALSALDQLEQNWQSYHDITGIFVNGRELDSLRDLLSELRPMVLDHRPELFSEIARMRCLIQIIYEEELPVLWHIL